MRRLIRQQPPQSILVVVQEIARDEVVLGVFIGDFLHAVGIEVVDAGVRVGEQDGGVGGDDELRVGIDKLVDGA